MNRIKECRKKRDIIQTDLAARLGLTQSGLSLWENGKADPGQEGWLKLSEILDVSTDYLMGNSDIPNLESLQLFAEPKHPDTTQNPLQEEMNAIFSSLPEEEKEKAMDYIRYLSQTKRREST